MKKFVLTILSVIYFTASIGATVNLYYCCDKFKNAALSISNNSSTNDIVYGDQVIYEGNNGCKDIHKQIKVSSNQDISSDVVLPTADLFITPLSTYFELNSISLSETSKDNFSSESAPPQKTIALYLKNCSFLI